MKLIDLDDAINQVTMIAKALAKSDKQKALCGRIIFMLEHRPTVKAIPLEKLEQIRKEIKSAYCKVENDYDRGRNYGLYMAEQFIDKAIKNDEK